MKTSIRNLFSIFLLLLFCSSCKMGLDDLEALGECELVTFSFENRYVGKEKRQTSDQDGNVIEYWVDKVMFDAIEAVKFTITQNTVNVILPATTDLKNVVGIASISVGSVIVPLEGSPQLGERGDFSIPRKYEVIAADGHTSKVWTIVTTVSPD